MLQFRERVMMDRATAADRYRNEYRWNQNLQPKNQV